MGLQQVPVEICPLRYTGAARASGQLFHQMGILPVFSAELHEGTELLLDVEREEPSALRVRDRATLAGEDESVSQERSRN